MSAIDDVMQEVWRLGDDGLSAYVAIEGRKYDDRVFQCDHSIARANLDLVKARAALAAKAPELARKLNTIVEVWGNNYDDWPGLIEECHALLAALREAAGD